MLTKSLPCCVRCLTYKFQEQPPERQGFGSMNVLGILADQTGSVASTFLWLLLIVTAATGLVIIIGVGIGKFITAGKPTTEPVHVVTQCGIHGHRYRAHHTGWRCTTCGEGALHEDELSDPVTVAPAPAKDAPASAPRAA